MWGAKPRIAPSGVRSSWEVFAKGTASASAPFAGGSPGRPPDSRSRSSAKATLAPPPRGRQSQDPGRDAYQGDEGERLARVQLGDVRVGRGFTTAVGVDRRQHGVGRHLVQVCVDEGPELARGARTVGGDEGLVHAVGPQGHVDDDEVARVALGNRQRSHGREVVGRRTDVGDGVLDAALARPPLRKGPQPPLEDEDVRAPRGAPDRRHLLDVNPLRRELDGHLRVDLPIRPEQRDPQEDERRPSEPDPQGAIALARAVANGALRARRRHRSHQSAQRLATMAACSAARPSDLAT